MPVSTEQESDEDLVARVQSGDDLAFASLARRHGAWLVRVCTGVLGDRHLAEDVAQECLVKAYRLIAADNAPARLRPWLRVVARHACIDEQRRRRPEPVDVVPECASTHSDAVCAPDYVVPEDLDVPLATAWKRLDSRHRDVLRRRELQGLTYAEIAATMGLSLAAVETLLFRARAALRREYARAGGTAFPSESLARGLLLVDKVDGAVPLTTALSNQAAHLVAQAAPAVTNTAQSGGALDGLRELAAGVAAAVVAVGLIVPLPAADESRPDAAVPQVQAIAVPDVGDQEVDPLPAPPDAAPPDSDVEAPDAPDAPDVPPTEPPPDPSPAADDDRRIRRAVDDVRKRVVGVTERLAERPREASRDVGEVREKILD